MKKLLRSSLCLVGLSALMSFATWQIIGPPDRSVECDPADLPEHFVCLSTVEKWPQESILWVDARPRADWERNGLEGAVLLNDQEEWFDLEPEFMMQMLVETRAKVVVYCNQSGCGSSKYVAAQLRERHAETLGFEVFVLEGGVKALKAAQAGGVTPVLRESN